MKLKIPIIVEIETEDALKLFGQLQECFADALPEILPSPDPMKKLLLDGPDCVPQPDEPTTAPQGMTAPQKTIDKKQWTTAPQKTIDKKQWTNLLHVGAQGVGIDETNKLIRERFNCKPSELPTAKYEEALAILRASAGEGR